MLNLLTKASMSLTSNLLLMLPTCWSHLPNHLLKPSTLTLSATIMNDSLSVRCNGSWRMPPYANDCQLHQAQFQSMVPLNLLKDFPIAHNDVTHTRAIFGPNLANSGDLKIPSFPTWKCHTHWGYIFCKQSFFPCLGITKSNLITIEHAPCCTASKLGHLFQSIVRVYTHAGFQVQTILMDN